MIDHTNQLDAIEQIEILRSLGYGDTIDALSDPENFTTRTKRLNVRRTAIALGIVPHTLVARLEAMRAILADERPSPA